VLNFDTHASAPDALVNPTRQREVGHSANLNTHTNATGPDALSITDRELLVATRLSLPW
jgi:hypothetical protein